MKKSAEKGKFTLEDYLNLVIFYKKQPFTRAQYKDYNSTCAQLASFGLQVDEGATDETC